MKEWIIDVYDYVNDKNELIVITIIKKNIYLVEKCKCFQNKFFVVNGLEFKKLSAAKKIINRR